MIISALPPDTVNRDCPSLAIVAIVPRRRYNKQKEGMKL
jgi:hypothetical protein